MASPPEIRRPLPRRYHLAVGIGQTILVWGGRGENIDTTKVENFDVSSLTWGEPRELRGNFPDAFANMAVTSDGQKAYIFGGLGSRGLNNELLSVDLASLQCKAVVPKSPFRPDPREHCRMVFNRNKLVSYGGHTGSVVGASNVLHVFDITSGKWKTQVTSGDKPPRLKGHSLTMIDKHRALLFGGSDGRNVYNDVYILDIRTWEWSRPEVKSRRRPPPRSFHVACCITDVKSEESPIVIVSGGRSRERALTDVWQLDINNMEWKEVGKVPPMMGHSGAVVGLRTDGFRVIVMFGGTKERGSIANNETNLLLFTQAEGCWVLERVVSQADLDTPDDSLRQLMKRLKPADDRVKTFEVELGEHQIRLHEAEDRLQHLQQETLDITQKSAEVKAQLVQSNLRAMEAENRAILMETQLSQANDRVQETQREIDRLENQLAESEARARESRERLVGLQDHVSEIERQMREGETRRMEAEERARDMEERIQTASQRQRAAEDRIADCEAATRIAEQQQRGAEERVMELEVRLQVAVERQREAEERMTEAENTREETEQRQGEFERRTTENEQLLYQRIQEANQTQQNALHRAQLAEGRLIVETQRRIEYEQRNQRLARSLQSSSVNDRGSVHWRIESREIHLSEEELGRGGWAAVKVAEFRGLQVAAKCLHSIIISDHNRQLFLREMNMAAKLRHPHLVQFIGATMKGEPIILTELMSTSLRDILTRQGLTQQQITTISRHIALALNYMHQITPDPVIHRDVSSANVLLNPDHDGQWVAKLSDYGSANFTRLVSTAGPGNPSYAAPEASDPARQSPKMDVFSFGVLLMEMVTGQFPDRDNLAIQLRQVSTPALSQLIQRCIATDPVRRPTIDTLLQEL